MNAFFQDWIYSLTISGMLCALVLYITPESKSKSLIETACTCIMILGVLSPLLQFDMDSFQSSLSNMQLQLNSQDALAATRSKEIIQYVIAKEYETYIMDESTAYQITLNEVEIITTEDDSGNVIPHEISYYTNISIPDAFISHIHTTLGVPKERQHIHDTSDISR